MSTDKDDRLKTLSFIDNIKSDHLPRLNIEESKGEYEVCHMHLAQLYYTLGDYRNCFYHLTECHGSLIRSHAVYEDLRREGCFGKAVEESSLKWDYLSSTGDWAKKEDAGLYERLSEMPPEWTIVQMSRVRGNDELFLSKDFSPKFRDVYISRMQCGPDPDELLVAYLDSSNVESDPLQTVYNSRLMITTRDTLKSRRKAYSAIEDIKNILVDSVLRDWKCVLLGKLEDGNLERNIRSRINYIFKYYNVVVSAREKQLIYLIAEGVCFYEEHIIRASLVKNLPKNKKLIKDVLKEIKNLPTLYPELGNARRHPVILILEDHLDCIPWESTVVLSEQAVTRISSVHLLHALFKSHQEHINHGLREIKDLSINYYVVNPDSNLPQSEAKLKPFFEARLPHWKSLVGVKPSIEQMTQVLSACNTYMYCGHGSGSHLIDSTSIQRLNLKNSIQFLFGCQSASLNFLGGMIPMMGHMLHYCIAGSACSVGFLYNVTSDDVDLLCMNLANYWLPGTPVHPKTLAPIDNPNFREHELLRVLPKIRKLTSTSVNGYSFIARGLPVKLVT